MAQLHEYIKQELYMVLDSIGAFFFLKNSLDYSDIINFAKKMRIYVRKTDRTISPILVTYKLVSNR